MEGYPLRLLVIVTILAVALPLLYSTFAVYDHGNVDRQLAASLDRLAAAARSAYSGPGTRLTIGFTVPTGFTAGVIWVHVGDVLDGEDASVIRFQLDGESPTTYVISSPNVPLTGPGNTTLELGPGEHRLHIEAFADLTRAWVQVSRVV